MDNIGRNKVAKLVKNNIEYRNYDLPEVFPILVLQGKKWVISEIPAKNLHFHNCLEIGYCEEGKSILKTADSQFECSGDDITVIGRDICHTTYSKEGERSKWSYIFVDFEELLKTVFPIRVIVNNEQFDNLIHNACMHITRDKDPDILMLVRTINREMRQRGDMYQHAIRGNAVALFIHILNLFKMEQCNPLVPGVQKKTENIVIAPALQYIQKNYMNMISVDMLSELCFLSSTHFRRLFTQTMGVSPLLYLTEVRIKKAAILLRTTEDSILEISEHVGFNSVSSFNRHFKKIIGSKPMQWRKEREIVKSTQILKYNGWILPPEQMETEERSEGIV